MVFLLLYFYIEICPLIVRNEQVEDILLIWGINELFLVLLLGWREIGKKCFGRNSFRLMFITDVVMLIFSIFFNEWWCLLVNQMVY